MRLIVSTLAVSSLLLSGLTAQSANWPSWRGDLAGSGESSERGFPIEWNKSKNVLWRAPLPNRGNSTPVVWGNRVFVTQVVEADDFRSVMCFDRNNGNLLWQQGVRYTEKERSHRTNPYCSASPMTDGERVVASFASAGVFCYDMNGRQLWKRDLGPQSHTWGNASSPLLYQNLCILYHGPGEGSFLIAMDKETGDTVWEWKQPKWDVTGRTDGFRGKDEDGVTGSFSTPIIVNANGRDELIMSFPTQIKAFDPATGKELWHCGGLNPLVYTSPVYGDGVVVAMGGFYGDSVAVKAGNRGDITGTHRLWHKVRHNGGIGSGVIKDGHLYYHNSGGIGYCLEIDSGRELWEERLRGGARAGGSWSSMVLVGDLVYYINQGGDTIVFKAKPEFEQVAANPLGEETNSSLVMSDGEIFIRTHEALWCIGRSKASVQVD